MPIAVLIFSPVTSRTDESGDRFQFSSTLSKPGTKEEIESQESFRQSEMKRKAEGNRELLYLDEFLGSWLTLGWQLKSGHLPGRARMKIPLQIRLPALFSACCARRFTGRDEDADPTKCNFTNPDPAWYTKISPNDYDFLIPGNSRTRTEKGLFPRVGQQRRDSLCGKQARSQPYAAGNL